MRVILALLLLLPVVGYAQEPTTSQEPKLTLEHQLEQENIRLKARINQLEVQLSAAVSKLREAEIVAQAAAFKAKVEKSYEGKYVVDEQTLAVTAKTDPKPKS